MRNALSKILSMGLIAIGLAGCGSSSTTPLASTASTGVGSSSVATGLIGFSGETNSFNQTTVLAGQLPYTAGQVAGNYGQIAAGSSYVTTANTGTAGSIQYTQKQAGTNGQFTFNATLSSTSQMNFTGTIQLSTNLMQEIEETYGANATVSSMGMWVVQSLESTTTIYSGSYLPTYSGFIAQVIVYLYINGAQTPVGPIVF